jgi:membrane protein
LAARAATKQEENPDPRGGTRARAFGCPAMAIKPVEWPAFSAWRQVLVRTWKEAGDDNVGLLAAGVAFYGFLAFVPLLASVVLTYGLVAEPATVAEHIHTLARNLPHDAAAIIADQLQAITSDKDGTQGIGLLLAIALAIYGASKGSSAVVTALNIAYEVKETRGFFARTALTMLMTVGMVLVVLAGAGAIAAFASIEHLLPFSSALVHAALKLLFWTAAAGLVSAGIALVYRYAPNRPEAPWRWITPGSAAAALLWLLASLGFGLYVSNFGNYNATYGSLGGVVVFLTWLYLTAYILLMGGELNSELERQQAQPVAAGAEPMKTGPQELGRTAAPLAEQTPVAASSTAARRAPARARLALLVGGGAAVGISLWRRARRLAAGEPYCRTYPGGRRPINNKGRWA